MTSHRTILPSLVLTLLAWPGLALGQQGQRQGSDPQVPIAQAVGCVELRDGPAATWWLTRATKPSVTGPAVFNESDVSASRHIELGREEFQLIGVADFLDAEALLRSGQRAEFTSPDQVNATNQLRQGARVLVKGLLIAPDEPQGTPARINLMMVVALADDCR